MSEVNSPDASRRRHRTGVLVKLVLFHFGSLLVFTTWAFGGQAPWGAARHRGLGCRGRVAVYRGLLGSGQIFG